MPGQNLFTGPIGAGVLTVFSVPKAFTGHIRIIQRNAIRSWTLLQPRPEVILAGNEDGTAQIAQELGLRHIPEITCNEHGTPLLSDLFRRAESNAGSPLLCYVNADIVLTSDFGRAVARVQEKLERFLIVSKRVNVDVAEPLSFEANWETSLQARARESGTAGDHTTIDVFVFPKGIYTHVPDFGIGRLWFDQWLIKAARHMQIPVVDVSRRAPVIHQNHDYNHVAGGAERVWRGREAEHNLQLYGGMQHAYTLLSVTHELTSDGAIQRVRFRERGFALKHLLWRLFVKRTVEVRNALWLRRKFWQTGKSAANSR
jgi:hypothetical protein